MADPTLPAEPTEEAAGRRHDPETGRFIAAGMSIEDRFDQKFVVNDNGCWEWIGGTSRGYGTFWVNGAMAKAHRWNYERHVGPIPPGLVIDHLCRSKSCVNPAHLEPVTDEENLLRGNALANKTHCPRGHAYDEENTRHYRGQRHCRACDRLRHYRRPPRRKQRHLEQSNG